MKIVFKLKVFEVATLFLMLVNVFPVVSIQASSFEENTGKLSISLETSNQNPKTKEFDVIIKVQSGLDSDRVILETNLSRYLEFVNEDDKRISIDVKAGDETIKKIKIKPIASVSGKITAVVTLIKADVYYTATSSIDIKLNENRELLPITRDYKIAKYLNYFKNSIIVAGSIVFVGIFVYLLYRRYLNLKNS